MGTFEEMMEEMMERQRKAEQEMEELLASQDGSHAIPHTAYFVGGKYHGLYMTHEQLKSKGNGNFTVRWSALSEHNPLLVNLDLEDQPMVDGYLSPMWDGGFLRYETQEVYDAMFD